MEIRTAAPQDLPAVTRLEALCFPPGGGRPESGLPGPPGRLPPDLLAAVGGGHSAGHGQRHDRPDPGPHRRHV